MLLSIKIYKSIGGKYRNTPNAWWFSKSIVEYFLVMFLCVRKLHLISAFALATVLLAMVYAIYLVKCCKDLYEWSLFSAIPEDESLFDQPELCVPHEISAPAVMETEEEKTGDDAAVGKEYIVSEHVDVVLAPPVKWLKKHPSLKVSLALALCLLIRFLFACFLLTYCKDVYSSLSRMQRN